MLSKFCLALLAAGGLALPAVADDDDDGSKRGGPKSAICHRTSAKAVKGFFPGHIITVSTNAAAHHVVRHRDVLLGPVATPAPRHGDDDDDDGGHKRAVCVIDARGNVYDGAGRLIYGVPTDHGGDEGGPG